MLFGKWTLPADWSDKVIVGIVVGIVVALVTGAIRTALKYKYSRYPIKNEELGLIVDKVEEKMDLRFDQAREIYEDLLPKEERVEWQKLGDIIELQRNFYVKLYQILGIYSVFLIGLKTGQRPRVLSLLGFTASRWHRCCFVSFLATRISDTGLSRTLAMKGITNLMLRDMTRHAQIPFVPFLSFPIIAELDIPGPAIKGNHERKKPKLSKPTLRIVAFYNAATVNRWYMKKVDISYLQPFVDYGDFKEAERQDRHEVEMLLILFLSRDESYISKRYLERILNFLARLYVTAECDPHNRKAYAKYLDKWKGEVLSSVRGPSERKIELKNLDYYLKEARERGLVSKWHRAKP